MTVADTTHSSIVIAAEPAPIMEVIADVERYPEWIVGLESVVVNESDANGRPMSATFHGNLGMVRDSYTVAYAWGDEDVEWHLTHGEKLTGMDGHYICRDRGDGSTEVEYRLAVELAIPVVGMLRRRGEKVIVDSALKGLKRRVEG